MGRLDASAREREKGGDAREKGVNLNGLLVEKDVDLEVARSRAV